MNKSFMKRSKQFYIFAITCLLLLVVLVTTQPLKLPLIFLFVPFILYFICVRSATKILLGKLKSVNSARKANLLAGSFAFISTLIIVLQSLGQLSWRDIIIALLMVSFAGLYLVKTDLV